MSLWRRLEFPHRNPGGAFLRSIQQDAPCGICACQSGQGKKFPYLMGIMQKFVDFKVLNVQNLCIITKTAKKQCFELEKIRDSFIIYVCRKCRYKQQIRGNVYEDSGV